MSYASIVLQMAQANIWLGKSEQFVFDSHSHVRCAFANREKKRWSEYRQLLLI